VLEQDECAVGLIVGAEAVAAEQAAAEPAP
jgi:hypothetical protein